MNFNKALVKNLKDKKIIYLIILIILAVGILAVFAFRAGLIPGLKQPVTPAEQDVLDEQAEQAEIERVEEIIQDLTPPDPAEREVPLTPEEIEAEEQRIERIIDALTPPE